jgi:hypothetical protein
VLNSLETAMSRTYRRRKQTHDHHWVLRDYACAAGATSRFMIVPVDIPARSAEGRKRLAKYHSDHASVYGQAPRHVRKLFNRRQRMGHRLEIAHWLKNSEHPVQCDPRTRHSATWAWW